jgi:integrase
VCCTFPEARQIGFDAKYAAHRAQPSTYASYKSTTRLHLIPRIGRKKLAQLTVRDDRLIVERPTRQRKEPALVQTPHATL